MAKKEKKQKVVYYDDGSTISDMSGVKGGLVDKTRPKKDAPTSTFGEKAKTFISAMKMMFLPMLTVLFVMTMIFLILSLLAN